MSNTFAIKEVLDYNVFTFSASGYGDLLFTVDYAAESTLSTTAQRLDLRGGQGYFKLVSIDYQKDCSFTSKLPLVDITALATKLGKSITTGATTANKKVILTADGSNTITLPDTPLTGTLKIYKLLFERDLGTEQTLGTPATTVDTYSISTATVTLNATTAPQGTKFLCTYEYTSGTAAQNIRITATDFPSFITVTGRGIVNDDQEGKLIPVSFKIHKAKVKPAFDLTMSSSKATELDFSLDCYTILNSDNVREFADIVKLSDEAV